MIRCTPPSLRKTFTFSDFAIHKSTFWTHLLSFSSWGVIEAHLINWEEKEPEVVKKIRKELYVDDLISGSITVRKAREVKDKATPVFRHACCTLHKWHSNAPKLEAAKS